MHQSQANNDAAPPWLALTSLPYWVAMWCCLSVLQKRASDIPPMQTLLPTVGIVLAAIALLHLGVRLVVRDRIRADLFVLVIVSFIGLHGPVCAIFTMGYRNLNKPLFLNIWLVVHTVVLAGLFVLPKKNSFVHRVASAVMIACALMTVLQVFNVSLPILGDWSRIADVTRLIKSTSPVDLDQPLVAMDETRPDIYYLIVDAYARQDVLKELYDFDNRPFIEALQDRGFYVGEESRSNYNFTEYSLASSLNMQYLDAFNLAACQTRMPLRHLIRESAVAKALKKTGYQTYAVETGKSETECDNFDHYVAFGKALNDYQDVLYHGTPLPQLLQWTGLTRSAARRHGDRVLFTLDQVPTLAKQSEDPAFVFCHILAPHPPFLFDRKGSEVEFRGHYLLSDCRNFTSCYGYNIEVYRNQYREQVEFINAKLIEMVDRIQASDRESVVILQADHGPRLGFGFQRDGDATSEFRFRECFSILNAIAMPDHRNSSFYPSMTPVNTFRLALNELFDLKLPALPDESYTQKKYKFTSVTRQALPLSKVAAGLAVNGMATPGQSVTSN